MCARVYVVIPYCENLRYGLCYASAAAYIVFMYFRLHGVCGGGGEGGGGVPELQRAPQFIGDSFIVGDSVFLTP